MLYYNHKKTFSSLHFLITKKHSTQQTKYKQERKSMRPASIYFSSTFLNIIWKKFQQDLKSDGAKSDYFMLCCDICDFAKKDFLQLTETDAQGYFDKLLLLQMENKLSLDTINVKFYRLHSISKFISIHQEEFNCNYFNPFIYVTIPQVSAYLDSRHVPTIEQMDAILAQAKDARLFLILSLIIRCGFTVGEICSMQSESFICDAAGNYAIRITYRNKSRFVKLPLDIVALINDYCSAHAIKSSYLFYNKRGNPLRPRDLQRLYESSITFNETLPKFILSDLRNGAAAYMLKNGASAKMVADYIGINPGWIHRYDKILENLQVTAVDYTNIRIVPPNNLES